MRYFNIMTEHNSGYRTAALTAIMAAFVCFVAAGCAGPAKGAAAGNSAYKAASEAEAQWGIRVKSVRETAEGSMLDVRYEISEPDKAAPVLNPDVKPYIVHKRTGKSLVVPNLAKVGPLQQTSNPPVKGVVYFMLFSNNKLVRPGDEVKLVIGEAVFDGLIVQ